MILSHHRTVHPDGTITGRVVSTEPNFRSVPKGAPKTCPHRLGFNCRTCYPEMPQPENHYRDRRSSW